MRALFLPVKSGLPGGARRVFCFERKPMNLTLASGKVTKSFVAGALALSVSGVAVPASFAAPSTPESQSAPAATSRTLDAAATKAKITQGLPGQFQVSYSKKNHKLWVAGTADGDMHVSALARLDADSLKVEAVAELPIIKGERGYNFEAAYGVEVDDVEGTVWVTNTRDNSISVYDQATMKLVWTNHGLDKNDANWIEHPREVRIDHASGKAFVSGRFYVSAIDLKTKQVQKLQLAGAPDGGVRYVGMNMHVDSQDHLLYVPERTSGKLFVVDTNTLKTVRTIDVHADTEGTEVRPSDVAIDKSLNEIYVSSQGVNGVNSGVTVYDFTTGEYKKTIAFGTQALAMEHDEERDLVYVSDFGTGKVGVIDGATSKVIGEVAMNGAKANDLTMLNNGSIVAVDKQDLPGTARVPYVLNGATGEVKTSDKTTSKAKKDKDGSEIPAAESEIHPNSIMKFKAEVKAGDEAVVQITPQQREFQGYPTEATRTVSYASPVIEFPDGKIDITADYKLHIKGSGYVGEGAAKGVYVFLVPEGTWKPGQSIDREQAMNLSKNAVWVRPEQLKDGSFEIDLPIPANTLEYGKKYTVGTIAAHDLSVTDRSLDYSAMFEITKDGQTSSSVSGPKTEQNQGGGSTPAQPTETAAVTAPSPTPAPTKSASAQPSATGGTTGEAKPEATQESVSVTVANGNHPGGDSAPQGTRGSTSRSLANTGANGVIMLAGMGALAIVAGAVVLVVRRRSKS